jgi:hypothetical protein
MAAVVASSRVRRSAGTLARSSEASATRTRSTSDATITTAIAAGRGRPVGSATSSIDTPARFTLEVYGAELVVAPAPAGTHGYEDLRRDATPMQIDEDLTVLRLRPNPSRGHCLRRERHRSEGRSC